jgi:hypothetical protein
MSSRYSLERHNVATVSAAADDSERPGAEFGPLIVEILSLCSPEQRQWLLAEGARRVEAGEAPNDVAVWIGREAIRPARAQLDFAYSHKETDDIAVAAGKESVKANQAKGGANSRKARAAIVDCYQAVARALHADGMPWPAVMDLCERMARSSQETRDKDPRFARLPTLRGVKEEFMQPDQLARALWGTKSIKPDRRPDWA